MPRLLQIVLITLVLVHLSLTKPVDPKKKAADSKKDGKKETETEELDDFGLEYGRYLQQVVQALEEDPEFTKKLQNISNEAIQSGKIAHELEFVKHNVRTKLDELKRIELERLRKLVQEQMERSELGLYRDENGRLLAQPDSVDKASARRWRTVTGRPGASEGFDRKSGGLKMAQHLDISNPYSFEINDLKKLIKSATADLEELDKQRRENFKQYELEKEAKYRESLKNMTDDQKKETEKHHDELLQKHKDHPKVHHPGSKDQLQQVWEEEDHMPKDEFNPKTFFAMHDINEDGHLDDQEVEAIVRPEIKKMYNIENEEDDPAEMEEEYHRMREHIFNETDKDKDGLISMDEFLKMAQQEAFQKDEGWKGLDEQQVYSDAELQEYMRQRQMAMDQQYYGNDPRGYYDVQQGGHQGLPPNINYHPNAYPQNDIPPQYHGMPQQQQYQGVPPQQQYQGVPPQQQYHGMPPQQQHPQYQAVPPQHQGMPQQAVPQYHQAVPQYNQGLPQQQNAQHQGVPQQQAVPQHQGMSQQQVPPQHQGIPQQHVPPQHQGIPQQQAPPQHQGIPQQQAPPQHQQHFQAPQVQALPNQQQPISNNQIPGEKKADVPNQNAIPPQQKPL